MRKQYHFRPSERGLLAWDVHRLIRLTMNLPRISVPLAAIRELDETFWFDHGTSPTCRAVADHTRLIEAADLAYPIILCSQGRVMDGMHRVCKAVILGWSHVEAVQFASDPEPDYIDADPDSLTYDEEEI
jgi:hypothetical protein